MGLLNIVIILSAVAFSLGEVARIQLQGTVAFTFLDVVTGLLVVLEIILFLRYKKPISKLSLFLPLIIFLGICFFSLVINPLGLQGKDLVVSGLYLGRYVMYASLYPLVSLFIKDKKNVIKAMVVSGAVIVGLGFIQYIYYPNLRYLYYLGWDEHLYRLFSTFLDPNFASMFFVLFVLFLVPFIEKAAKKKEKKRLVLYSILGASTVFAIVLTYSRTGFIMLVVGLGVYLSIQKRFKILAVSIAIFLVMIVLTSSNIEGMNPLRIASSEARIGSMAEAFAIFKKHPIIGVGFDSYQFALYNYGFRKPNFVIQSHAVGGTDNSFLFVAATTGLLGFVSYLYFLGSILWLSFRRMKQKVFLSDTLFSSTIAVSVGSFFINGLFYPMILFWLWTLCGLIED